MTGKFLSCLVFIISKFKAYRLRIPLLSPQKNHTQLGAVLTLHRGVLSSQEAILQLLSALLSLTSVFGMGTGVASMPSSRHVI